LITVARACGRARKAIVPLQISHILYRILFSALILLSLLWLALADWPAAHLVSPSAKLDSQSLPAGAPVESGLSTSLGVPLAQ
jgi:hypothetical protein